VYLICIFLIQGVDECVVIALKYANQRMASVCISGNGYRMSNTTIAGDKGVLYVSLEDQNKSAISVI